MRGELNVGQLVRERHPRDCRSIGFTTYTGTVTAADDWGTPARRKQVRPALAGSVEKLFHDTGRAEFLLSFATSPHSTDVFSSARLEPAIGVIYRPQTERQSHYFGARLADQFDAVIHLDAVVVAYAESKLVNSTQTDHDSEGLFQQRVSIYTKAVADDPVKATNAFLDRLVRVPNWHTDPLGEAAQAVQHSQPGAGFYAPAEPLADALVGRLWPAASAAAAGSSAAQRPPRCSRR